MPCRRHVAAVRGRSSSAPHHPSPTRAALLQQASLLLPTDHCVLSACPQAPLCVPRWRWRAARATTSRQVLKGPGWKQAVRCQSLLLPMPGTASSWARHVPACARRAAGSLLPSLLCSFQRHTPATLRAAGKHAFYARPPYINKDLGAGSHVTRFIALAGVSARLPFSLPSHARAVCGACSACGLCLLSKLTDHQGAIIESCAAPSPPLLPPRLQVGVSKQKWLHALALTPAAQMTPEQVQRAAGGPNSQRARCTANSVQLAVRQPNHRFHPSAASLQHCVMHNLMAGGGGGGGGGGGRGP